MLCLGAPGLGIPCCGSSGVRGLSPVARKPEQAIFLQRLHGTRLIKQWHVNVCKVRLAYRWRSLPTSESAKHGLWESRYEWGHQRFTENMSYWQRQWQRRVVLTAARCLTASIWLSPACWISLLRSDDNKSSRMKPSSTPISLNCTDAQTHTRDVHTSIFHNPTCQISEPNPPITGKILTRSTPDDARSHHKFQNKVLTSSTLLNLYSKNVMYGKIKHCKMDIARVS